MLGAKPTNITEYRLSAQAERRLVLVAPAIAAAIVIWAAVAVSATGVEAWRFALAVTITVFVCWGFGGAAQLWMGSDAVDRAAPIPRIALGFVLVVGLIPLLGELRIGVTGIAAIVAILALAANLVVWRKGHAERGLSLHDAADWISLAVLLRVFAAGTQYVRVGATTQLTQYWDLTYHLAQVKEVLFRGLPSAQNPLLAGAPRPAYHPAFDDFAALLIRGSGLPPNAGLYGVVLPLLGVAFVAGLLTLTNYAVASRRAHYFTLLVLAGFVIGALLPFQALRDLMGPKSLAYFGYNPPAAAAAVAAALSVALFARGFVAGSRRPLILAAVLAGLSVSIKANVALALGPAFVTAVGVLAWRRRDIRLFIGVGFTALAAAVISYLPTRGQAASMAIDLGAYSRFARQSTSGILGEWLAHQTQGAGLLGDAVFLATLVLVLGQTWMFVPAFLALVRRPRFPIDVRESLSRGSNTYLIAFVMWALIAGFTIVQVDVGRFSSWNISGHTLAHISWIGVVLAAIGLYRIAVKLLGAEPPLVFIGTALAVLLAMTPLAMQQVTAVRQVGSSEIPTELYELLQRVPEYVDPDAVVAQNFETERDAWVSGLAGRGAVLERAETARAYFPEQERVRADLLSRLYGASTVGEASEAAEALGVRYAIVRSDAAAPLLAAGTAQLRVGEWMLIEID